MPGGSGCASYSDRILIFLAYIMNLTSLTTMVNSMGAMDRPKGRDQKFDSDNGL